MMITHLSRPFTSVGSRSRHVLLWALTYHGGNGLEAGLAADGDHLRPVFGEPGLPRHRQHEADTVQDRVGEGHDVALDGRPLLGDLRTCTARDM